MKKSIANTELNTRNLDEAIKLVLHKAENMKNEKIKLA